MTGLKLSAAAYQRVFEMSQAIDDVRVFKRAQALLWLHECLGTEIKWTRIVDFM